MQCALLRPFRPASRSATPPEVPNRSRGYIPYNDQSPCPLRHPICPGLLQLYPFACSILNGRKLPWHMSSKRIEPGAPLKLWRAGDAPVPPESPAVVHPVIPKRLASARNGDNCGRMTYSVKAITSPNEHQSRHVRRSHA